MLILHLNVSHLSMCSSCFHLVLFAVDCVVSRTVRQPFACDLVTYVKNCQHSLCSCVAICSYDAYTLECICQESDSIATNEHARLTINFQKKTSSVRKWPSCSHARILMCFTKKKSFFFFDV